MTKLRVTLIDHAHHRNGISGQPFDVALFEHDGEDFVAIMLDNEAAESLGYVPCFVLRLDLLTQHNIAFAGGNSWRGGQFVGPLQDAIYKAEEES